MKLSLVQNTFSLYDLRNMLKNTFISELDKYITIYGSISYFDIAKENKEVYLITHRNKLNLSVKKDAYKEEI